jgi:hypothetical protein
MVRQAERKFVNDVNREIRKTNAHNQRVVRAHNDRVRSNQRRRLNELSRLNSQSTTRTTTRFVTYEASVQTLQRSFVQIEEASEQERWVADDDLFEMAEGEAANSAATLNALLDEPTLGTGEDLRLQETIIANELRDISPDLDDRWSGALFSLNPRNRDAARHFCTSSREILVKIIDLNAPDKTVLAGNPDVSVNEYGKVLRREKIRYILGRRGNQITELVDFVEDDINNVMDLFGDFNPATHGEAGRYDMLELSTIKNRVEGAIQFLHRIVSY